MDAMLRRWVLAIMLLLLVVMPSFTIYGQNDRGILRLPYTPQSGGGAEESLDPSSPVRFAQANVLLYNRLVRPDESNRPSPELATDWTSNEDSTIWTFNLRPDVRFHNGAAFTSADVIYSITYFTDPDRESPLRSLLGSIATVEAEDRDTVVFALSQSDPFFPSALMFHTVRIIQDGSAETVGETGIGTGPFKLETFDPAGTTVLVANDEYWEGRPGVAAVEVTSIPDGDAQISALQAGQIDAAFFLSAQQTALFAGNSAYTILASPAGTWYGFMMDANVAPFDDVRVRQAFRAVIDRQEMLEFTFGDGNGTIACDSPIWAGDPYFEQMSCDRDVEGARALLAEAGYPEGIAVDLVTSSVEPVFVTMAEVFQRQAADAGISVNLVQHPADTYYDQVVRVSPFYLNSHGQRTADSALNQFFTEASGRAYWVSSEFEALIAEARATVEREARVALYHELQQVLQSEGALIIPFFVNQLNIVSSRLENVPAVEWGAFRWHEIRVSG
jgi:peptide/nickel transport system substrate-binding protein